MKKITSVFLLLTIISFASVCHASDAQPCDKQVINLVGKHFDIEPFWTDRYDSGGLGFISAQACKVWPYDKNKTIAAFFYITEPDSRFGKFIMAMIENNKIVASYRGKPDLWELSKIQVDTTHYDIAEGKVAFGIDTSDAYRANCGDGGWGMSRKLYLVDETSLLPITSEILLDKWNYIKGGRGRCGGTGPLVMKETESLLSTGEGESNGFANLLLTEKTTYRNDPGSTYHYDSDYLKISQYQLQFNGSEYIHGPVMPSFDCRKATTKVEKNICDSALLSDADNDLNALYKQVLRNSDQPEPTRKEQRKWLKRRNTCSDKACIRDAYKSRLQTLVSVSKKQIMRKLKPNLSQLNQQQKDSALLDAAADGNGEMVIALLKQGADVNGSRYSTFSPLDQAAFHGHINTVELLLENGANVDGSKRHSPLGRAAWKSHHAIIELLLDKGANIDGNKRSETTPLGLAAFNGDKDTVELLLEKGANIDGNTNSTPLGSAASRGQKMTVEILIARGANINARGYQGQTPLIQVLDTTVASNNREIFELLISAGADINTQDKNLYTPLHFAARRGKKELAEVLVENGADVNATASNGATPLSEAIRYGSTDVAEFLRAKMAGPDSSSN